MDINTYNSFRMILFISYIKRTREPNMNVFVRFEFINVISSFEGIVKWKWLHLNKHSI